MAASGSRVFVLGGESFTAPKPDDPSVVHVLDARTVLDLMPEDALLTIEL